MTTILVLPPELRSKAEELRNHANRIHQEIENVDQQLAFLNADRFEGRRAEELRSKYQQKREYLLVVYKKVIAFSDKLDQAASAFTEADQQKSVLGASTVSYLSLETWAQKYAGMNWKDRFGEMHSLDEEIKKLKDALSKSRGLDAVNSDLLPIEQKIAELQAKRAEAEKNANNLFNQVIPDFPLTGDNDGLPWRVQADDYQDQMAEYDRQIAELQGSKQALERERNLIIDNTNSLENVEARKASLTQLMDQGVPADGPTRSDLLNSKSYGLGGCVNYVAEKRNVTEFGNGHPGSACQWVEQAKDAGFETGNIPVKGSIMVFQPGVEKTNSDVGHVGYVEDVVLTDDGYKVTISQANTQYDANGNFIRGSHVRTKDRTFIIPINGAQPGIDFIYGKL